MEVGLSVSIWMAIHAALAPSVHAALHQRMEVSLLGERERGWTEGSMEGRWNNGGAKEAHTLLCATMA